MNLGLGIGPTLIGPAFSWSPSRLRVGTRDVRDLTLRPNRMYSNLLGTTLIAGPGAEVAAMRDSRGVMVATQTTFGARPKYAVEPAVGVRNRIRNNRGDGATLGVIGSGGVLPTGWFISNAPGAQIIGQGFEDGFPFIDIEMALTPTGNIGISLQFGTPAVLGEVWTHSFSVRRIAGDDTNIVRHRNMILEFNGTTFVAEQEADITASVATGSRVETTRTLTGSATTNVRGIYGIVWTSGAIDIRLRVKWMQIERAAAATAVQTTGADGFDVTEAGQRSLDVLVPDATDDFMTLFSVFEPTGAYTLATARMSTGTPGGITFAGTTGAVVFSQSQATFLGANGGGNSVSFSPAGWPSGAANARRLDLARVSGATTAQAWRNGVLATSGITLEGNLIPIVGGLTRLFVPGSSGRFYGGVMIDEGDTPFTDAERLMTQRYLAYKGGITL